MENGDNAKQIQELFTVQQNFASTIRKSSPSERIHLLNRLEESILKNRRRLQEALDADFGKPPQEVDLVDIYWVLHEIRHTRQHLRQWMRPRKVPTPLALIGSRSHLTYEPKGVCLILSPWNYPVNLTFGPLVGAIAAGCTAILKPSEFTPRTGELMKELINNIFPREHVAVLTGGNPVAQILLKLPFNHIFFTGSTEVGKIVMRAAAEHLTSVTLELGGKCPAIILSNTDLKSAARRILQTKFVNAGQTCIAPDYILIDVAVADKFIDILKKELHNFYPNDVAYAKEYSGIVHEGHMQKIESFIQDAIDQGAKVVVGGSRIPGTNKLLPTILTQVHEDAKLMQEEIFGPILPVLPFDNINFAVEFINRRPRPLGLYVFGKGRVVHNVLNQTHAGGSCINHCAINFYNPNLPFGGVGNSGIGKSHGFETFKAFSNPRGVYRQVWKFAPINWLHPPYTRAKQWLIDFTLKWL